MPGQDGYALMRAIRGLPGGEGGHVRAIAVSAYARREDRQRALKAGFNDHVCKPVQPDDLYDALERVWVQSAPSTAGRRRGPERQGTLGIRGSRLTHSWRGSRSSSNTPARSTAAGKSRKMRGPFRAS